MLDTSRRIIRAASSRCGLTGTCLNGSDGGILNKKLLTGRKTVGCVNSPRLMKDDFAKSGWAS
jgi:hypothetical protein